jgi:hypothetical protein
MAGMQFEFNSLMQPSDVAECLQGLADAYTKAAADLILSPGDFEADTANGNVVELDPLEEEGVVNRDDKGQIDKKATLTPYPSVYC